MKRLRRSWQHVRRAATASGVCSVGVGPGGYQRGQWGGACPDSNALRCCCLPTAILTTCIPSATPTRRSGTALPPQSLRAVSPSRTTARRGRCTRLTPRHGRPPWSGASRSSRRCHAARSRWLPDPILRSAGMVLSVQTIPPSRAWPRLSAARHAPLWWLGLV